MGELGPCHVPHHTEQTQFSNRTNTVFKPCKSVDQMQHSGRCTNMFGIDSMIVLVHYCHPVSHTCKTPCFAGINAGTKRRHLKQCCSAVRSTVSAALRAVRRSIRSTAVYCGELYCVVESRNGVNRTLSLRAFRFIKARFFAKHFFPRCISEGNTTNQQCVLTISSL